MWGIDEDPIWRKLVFVENVNEEVPVDGSTTFVLSAGRSEKIGDPGDQHICTLDGDLSCLEGVTREPRRVIRWLKRKTDQIRRDEKSKGAIRVYGTRGQGEHSSVVPCGGGGKVIDLGTHGGYTLGGACP